MKRRILFVSSALLVILFMVSGANPWPSSAQSSLRWSLPQRIRGIADYADPPYLVADQDQTVHAFYSQWKGNNLAVFYNKWTLKNGWTDPIDILLSPQKQQATVLGAFLDSKGLFHVIFYGGVDKDAAIYYSKAPAVNAAQTRAWSQPKAVGIRPQSPGSGAIIGDDQGNLFIIYSGNRDGNGVYALYSADGGNTWSNPISVFLSQKGSLLPYFLSMHFDEQGWAHTVWAVMDKNGQGRSLFYARLNIQNRQWGLPIALAESPSGLGIESPAITVYSGKVIAAFYDADLGGHQVTRSSNDSGQTWTNPFTPFPQHIGGNGAGSFVVDANNELHLFWGQRIPGTQSTPETHGMWHSIWQSDNRWSQPEAIVSGPITSEFDPSIARAVASQGNVLLVTWRQDPGLDGNGVWYSYANLDARELPIRPLPTPVAVSTVSPEATEQTSVDLRSPSPLFGPTLIPEQNRAPQPAQDSDPSVSLLIAVLPVALILLIVFVAQSLRRLA